MIRYGEIFMRLQIRYPSPSELFSPTEYNINFMQQ